ncbi:MAG: c-type cytochrome biogenesis protein CcmI [Rhodobacteraceae bacterium]|nr:c-type cytochrome biogenesis protein CcmI [Paracoccaceae bacterium]
MFWPVAVGLVLLSLLVVARVLLRRDQVVSGAAELDLQVYKDQLAEVERDLVRGVLGEADAEAARTEVARRILAADKRAGGEEKGTGADRTVTFISIGFVGLVLAGSLALYSQMGAPGVQDQPLEARLKAAQEIRANRPGQEVAEANAPRREVEVDAEYAELVAQLREVVKTRTDDAQGFRLLANHEARLGNFTDARIAQQRVLELVGDKATEADYTDLAEIMIIAAGGYVSPGAEDALAKAVNMNPKSQRARYYSGLALAQNGRPDIAYRMWEGLLQEGPGDAPWIPLIQAQIGAVAQAAGISRTDLNAPGPTAEDIENTAEIPDDDRQQMIRGMVTGLAERLATEGGTPAEWARLIRAYGVLGETGKANAIWNEAQSVFDGNTEAMTLLREAAESAEVAQ